jgi:hypothetical protein
MISHNISFYKILAIVYSTSIYVLSGIILTILLDKYVFKYINKNTIKPLYIIILEILFILICISLLEYFCKEILELIPFPFENFTQQQMNTDIYLSHSLLIFSGALLHKIEELKAYFQAH